MRGAAGHAVPLWVGAFAMGALAAPGARGAGGADDAIRRVVSAYGGESALDRAKALREVGRVSSTMRGGVEGALRREFAWPDRLRVEVAYPGEPPEIRVLDGARGWRDGAEVTGPPYEAMVLQAARLALPLSLLRNRDRVVERGTVEHDGRKLRELELPLGSGMSIVADVDPGTGRILRSAGTGPGGGESRIEFVTTYSDFRKVDGIWVAFREGNFAMGRQTGETVLDHVEVLTSLPAATFRP